MEGVRQGVACRAAPWPPPAQALSFQKLSTSSAGFSQLASPAEFLAFMCTLAGGLPQMGCSTSLLCTKRHIRTIVHSRALQEVPLSLRGAAAHLHFVFGQQCPEDDRLAVLLDGPPIVIHDCREAGKGNAGNTCMHL